MVPFCLEVQLLCSESTIPFFISRESQRVVPFRVNGGLCMSDGNRTVYLTHLQLHFLSPLDVTLGMSNTVARQAVSSVFLTVLT